MSAGTVVTVRLIRSFEYRTMKPLVMKDVDLSITARDFISLVLAQIQQTPGLASHRTKKYDAMKLHHKAHSFKTQNLIINTDDAEFPVFNPDQTLAEQGVEHETEVSMFVLAEYEAYKKNPEVKWY